MKLFIANCTKMHSILNYRILEIKNPLSQSIESGQQIMVAKPDLNMPQITHIIEQLKVYGLFLVEELGTIPPNAVIHWLAATEKPIPRAKIEKAMQHNATALTLRGVEFRKTAALAINNNIANTTPHAAGTLEITVQEDSPTDSNPIGEPLIAEGYRIDHGAGRQ